jgi:hypothetical protein
MQDVSFKRNFVRRVLQKIVSVEFQVLENLDVQYSHLKERKIVDQMSGRPALRDVSL